jgi:hypothetical protein
MLWFVLPLVAATLIAVTAYEIALYGRRTLQAKKKSGGRSS